MTDPGTTPPRAGQEHTVVLRINHWATSQDEAEREIVEYLRREVPGIAVDPPAEPAEEREPEVFEFPISRHAYGRFVQESDYAKAIAERDEARFDLSVALPEVREQRDKLAEAIHQAIDRTHVAPGECHAILRGALDALSPQEDE
jgi:hypothetical protein